MVCHCINITTPNNTYKYYLSINNINAGVKKFGLNQLVFNLGKYILFISLILISSI